MSYPKYMTDEQLAAFGFAVDNSAQEFARHTIYPNLSVRYRCPRCDLWASTMKGGATMVCEQCHKGGRKIDTEKQFQKLYQCCSNRDCRTWIEAKNMLRKHSVEIVDCHDGFGGYLDISSIKEWPVQRRIELHVDINQYSVSKFGARKLQCDQTGKLRSQLPKNAV